MRIGETWIDVEWEEFLIPKGDAPRPPDRTIIWSPTVAHQQIGQLRDFTASAGRYNPRLRLSKTAEGEDAYEFIDRPWSPDELGRMVEDAKSVLARTGFVTQYEQHFLIERGGAWFIFADPGAPVDRDAVEERYDDVIFADPTRFDYLPKDISDAAGGPYGRLAWAMEVLKRSKVFDRIERRAELVTCPVGRIGEAFGKGRPEDAAAHLAWLLSEAWRTGWSDGTYFECVRVSDAVGRQHREDSGKQSASIRSVQKRLREAAMTKFIDREDPDAALTDLELARRAQASHSNAEPIFEEVDDLLDVNDPANPKETAKEIGRLRKAARKMAAQRALNLEISAGVTALLRSD